MPNRNWNVLVTEDIDRSGIKSLSEIAEVQAANDCSAEETTYANLDSCHAILVRTSNIGRELMENFDDLRVISKHGTGLDNVDVASASEHNVLVCNTPHVNATAVAEHTIALLLSVQKQLLAADKDIRRGDWDRSKHTSHELRGSTLGLFGCGAIGNKVGEAVQSLGIDCIAYDPYIDESELSEEIFLVTEKEKLFGNSDLISIHTPLTPETQHAISTNELSRLPDEGVVVNTSRGGIVEEEALVTALSAGELAGVGLDVFADEPPSSNHPLLEFDTVIATPHIGGSTFEALRQMSIDAANNIRTVYEGKIPDSTVNADEVEII